MIEQLTLHQRQALRYVESEARGRHAAAHLAVLNAIELAGLSRAQYDEAMRQFLGHPRVDVHFHPERVTMDGIPVVEGLMREARFTSQYETGLSGGSPTAQPGGERDAWERRLFGSAYHAFGVTNADRPKYGALEVLPHPDGASPRFGSCFFVLREEVAGRCTFTFLGSQEDDALDRAGTLRAMEPVMAALVDEVARDGGGLGDDELSVAGLVEHLAKAGRDASDAAVGRPLGRALDSFIEAQVHGPINLRTDVRALVADPAFRGGSVGDALQDLSARFGFGLTWHPGFVLPVEEVPEVFRGYALTRLAERSAHGGLLNAATIGRAANAAESEPDAWRDGGTVDELRTRFRRLWHVLVLYGTSRDPVARLPASSITDEAGI
jgi:hypothetical protein